VGNDPGQGSLLRPASSARVQALEALLKTPSRKAPLCWNDKARTALLSQIPSTIPTVRNPVSISPVDRALSIYSTLANRSENRGTRERLSKHLMKVYLDGEKDEHRLTVHGLSYLRDLDRKIEQS
jgi:hypothetical protein